jgi:predicted Holliday junction resolvase-like endonuclease
MTTQIIRQLSSIPGLRLECPNCAAEIPIGRAKLFSMYAKYPPPVRKLISKRFATAAQMKESLTEERGQLKQDIARKPARIGVAAQSSLFGQISEQILPAFTTFPYTRNECRILLRPIDYVVFRGLSRRSRIDSIQFVDVKTQEARLTKGQRQIRDRIRDGHVKHRVIGR